MSKCFLSSLRSRALGLILLAILPLLGLTLYSYFDQRDREIREAQTDELVTARYIATSQETFLRNTRHALTILARLPEVQRRDRAACNVLFAELLKQSPDIASIVAVNSAGLMFANAPASPDPINYADRSWFHKVIQTRDFVAGVTVLGRTSGKYGNILAYPILDSDGRFRGALAAQFDLEWLGNLLKKSNFPSNTAIVLTDSSHKVLFRYPDPQKYLGQLMPEAFIKPMTENEEGVAAGVGLPKDQRLFAFVRLAPPWQEMWVTIGLPQEWVLAPVNRLMWRSLIFLGLVTLIAMAAAWYGGELFVVRPVRKLQVVTEQVAAGDLAVRCGPDFTVGELGILARSFDRMAAALQERQTALQESEERLRLAQNAAQVGVWEWKPQEQTLEWTPELESLYGLQPGAIRCYQDWTKLVHPEDLSHIEAEHHEAIAKHHPFDLEFRIIHTSGETRWVQARGRAYYDEDGRPERVFGTNFDITERKRAEKETQNLLNAVQQEKEKLSALINSISDEVWFADTQKKFSLANPQALAEFKIGPAEEIDVEKLAASLEVYRADGSTRPVEEAPPLRALQGEVVRNAEELIRTPASGENRYRQVSAAPVRDVNGNIIGSVSVVRDITELKQAEEALRQAKDELEQRVQERTAQLREQAELIQDLYNNAPCGYHSLDPDGTFVQINNTELNWLGYTRDEVVGRMKFSDLLTADSLNTFQKNFPDFKERGWARNLEFELLRKDGSTLPVLLSATAIKDEAGNYMMSRSTVYDIRDRKLAERVIKESEARLRYLASRLLTAQEDERRRIARDLHEDLGQSLAVLKLQLGAFGRSLPEEIREAKSGIEELLNYINEIVDEVRAITYNLRPPVLDLGITAALHSLVQEFLIDQDMELSLNLCDMNGLFSPEEETGIYRVFQEALTNIYNHAQATRIVITAKQEQDIVAFKIDDNGQGFYLKEVQGHGAQDRKLGLATMDERVRIMGGSLKILSTKGTGTSIAFSIPISPIQKTA
jgi:PAS domain S-box-containing protein